MSASWKREMFQSCINHSLLSVDKSLYILHALSDKRACSSNGYNKIQTKSRTVLFLVTLAVLVPWLIQSLLLLLASV